MPWHQISTGPPRNTRVTRLCLHENKFVVHNTDIMLQPLNKHCPKHCPNTVIDYWRVRPIAADQVLLVLSSHAQSDSTSDWHIGIHYGDLIITAMASQITGSSIVCLVVCSGADQRKYQSSVSLASVRGIHRWPVNSPHKRPVTRKMLPLDDVIMFDVGPDYGSSTAECLWD